MTFPTAVAQFLGGAFLANFVPHFVAGVSGRPFPTPFATPPFRGASRPPVNVLWALINLCVAYLLLVVIGATELRAASHAAMVAAGFGLGALGISWRAGKLLTGLGTPPTGQLPISNEKSSTSGP